MYVRRSLVLSAALALLVPGTCFADAAADFQHGAFAAAEREFSDILDRNPKNAEAAIGLATLRLYLDEIASAHDIIVDAGLENSTDPRVGRILTEVDRRSEARDSDYVTIPQNGTHANFAVSEPLPIVPVKVDGHEVYFMLDTGAPDAVVDADFARELGLTMTSSGTGIFAGGSRAPIQRAKLDSLEVGSAKVRHLTVTVMPTRRVPFGGNLRVDGIIGTGFLYRFLATIDYPRARLELRPRKSWRAFEREASSKHALGIPMWLVGDHYVFARASINDGPEQMFNIDTGGAGFGVTATAATIQNSHVSLDQAHATKGIGGGGPVTIVPFSATVTLGEASQANVMGAYTPEGSPYGIFPFEVGGSVTDLFFRPYAVTFDFMSMKLVLTPIAS